MEILVGILAVITWIGVQAHQERKGEDVHFWHLVVYLAVFYFLFWLVGGFENGV